MYFNQSALHARQVVHSRSIRIVNHNRRRPAEEVETRRRPVCNPLDFHLVGRGVGRRRVANRKATFVFLGISFIVHRLELKRGAPGAQKRGSKSTPTFATECENYRGFQ